MGQTIVEKIIAKHLVVGSPEPGAIVTIDIDLLIANELSTALALDIYEELDSPRILHPDRFALALDHVTPNKDQISANLVKRIRDFAIKNKIKHLFNSGEGIEHILFPENGLIEPGMTVFGGDSHTCTYGALNAFAAGTGSTDMVRWFVDGKAWLKIPESILINITGKLGKFTRGKDLSLFVLRELGLDGARYKSVEYKGETISNLPMSGRFTLCNMATEMGSKNVLLEVDEITENYLHDHGVTKINPVVADADAVYEQTLNFNVEGLPAMVAQPSLPTNAIEASELEEQKIAVNQVYIGSCTNGHLSDLQEASEILSGNKVAKNVRCIVVPGTRKIYTQALELGIIDIFLESGAVVSAPTCGACLGSFNGVLSSNEVCISTTNRNFVGRMGAKNSQVYLASPMTAAASAITGYITDPANL